MLFNLNYIKLLYLNLILNLLVCSLCYAVKEDNLESKQTDTTKGQLSEAAHGNPIWPAPDFQKVNRRNVKIDVQNIPSSESVKPENKPETSNVNSKNYGPLKWGSAAFTTLSLATYGAYKKSPKARKKIDNAYENTQDYVISNIICPVLIKWETLKEERFTKKDGLKVLLYSGSTLGCFWIFKKLILK